MRLIRLLASDGPSTRSASGSSRSSSDSTLRAEPGPWWRIPRIVAVTSVLPRLFGDLATGLVQVAPAVALLHDGLEVLAPDGGVLHRVPDDRASQAGRNVVRLELAVTEMCRQRQALVDHRDRLGGRKGCGRDLELVLAVLGLAGAELAEDRDDSPDLLEGWRLRRQIEGTAHLPDPLLHDLDFLLDRRRQRQDDGIEPPPEGRRELVDTAVAVIRRRDHVEAVDRLNLLAKLGDRQGLLGQDRDEGVLDVRRDPRELFDPDLLAVGHADHDGAGDERGARRALGEQPG